MLLSSPDIQQVWPSTMMTPCGTASGCSLLWIRNPVARPVDGPKAYDDDSLNCSAYISVQ